jgi:hypothetical protein
MVEKIRSKPCLHQKCKNRHKSEGYYCAEHAHEADRQLVVPRGLVKYGSRRTCSSPHLAEDEANELGIEWSLRRNVI